MLRQIGLLIVLAFSGLLATAQRTSPPVLREHREAAGDLEVTGLVKGVPPGASRFVSEQWIAGLPRVSFALKNSEDFQALLKSGTTVSGVTLETLVQSLGAKEDSSVIQATCRDGYTATYTREYMHQHRPVLILTMEGLSLHDWAAKNHDYDASPYFVGYEDFVPAFRVLSHQDQPLEPSEVLKLSFDTEQRVYAPIQPKPVAGSADVAVEQGYRIARQNCFRCHNAGADGGTKAAKSWSTLGGIAKNRPEKFAAVILNPKAIDPDSEMPANPQYDTSTLNALTKYFSTFAVEGK